MALTTEGKRRKWIPSILFLHPYSAFHAEDLVNWDKTCTVLAIAYVSHFGLLLPHVNQAPLIKAAPDKMFEAESALTRHYLPLTVRTQSEFVVFRATPKSRPKSFVELATIASPIPTGAHFVVHEFFSFLEKDSPKPTVAGRLQKIF